MVHFCPTVNECNAIDTAHLFVDYVFRLHGLPMQFVSDRDTRLNSHFFQEVCSLLGVDHIMSTAFHPQTDG